MSQTEATPHQLLHKVFGFKSFREPQQAVVEQLIAGRDVLVIMPTGGGKSLCYQLPALLRPGVGIVISPLIALMQDQVMALQQLGIRAAFLNSTLDVFRVREIESQLHSGEIDVLYLAPERLIQERTLALLSRISIALFAIDEAHCVSQWGHDFRTDYLALHVLAEHFPAVPRIALTATADERTRNEIITRLALREPEVHLRSFDRPNIRYSITEKQAGRTQLLHFLRDAHPHSAGIVYCLSRAKVETSATWLCAEGFNALPYHAGMSAAERAHNQQRFLREEGVIIVATIAFGMGIDKPDVRFVAHLDLPKSLESYYQETGRAGRDGQAADAWMVYGLQDVIKLRQMLEDSEAADEHKRVERQKLESMLGFCETIGCRRQALLQYFGEAYPQACGNCDTCLQPADTWDATEAAQKAISCAYRSGQRFGANHLIDILLGKETPKVQQNRHQAISTFGIGGELSVQQWRSVFRQLVARGLLLANADAFGALQLTAQCRLLLRGEQRVQMRRVQKPSAKSKAGSGAATTVDHGSPLWQALRALRRKLADANGLPSFAIFPDASLREMLQRLPGDRDQMLAISGVGEKKMERYGEQFLAVIAEFSRSTITTEHPAEDAEKTSTATRLSEAAAARKLDAESRAAPRQTTNTREVTPHHVVHGFRCRPGRPGARSE